MCNIWLNHSLGFLVPPPSLHFCTPSHLFQWVRLGLEAKGPSAAAREGDRGTKMKGGGGGRNPILGKSPTFYAEIKIRYRSIKKSHLFLAVKSWYFFGIFFCNCLECSSRFFIKKEVFPVLDFWPPPPPPASVL